MMKNLKVLDILDNIDILNEIDFDQSLKDQEMIEDVSTLLLFSIFYMPNFSLWCIIFTRNIHRLQVQYNRIGINLEGYRTS
jgi:hypothetical protein